MKFFGSLLAFGVAVAGCLSATAQQRVNWVHLDNVSLTANEANDGDSFHARRNRSQYLVRLYFVDAPETDRRFPERLQEQAAYFGVTEAQVLRGGRQADAFVRKRLEKAPFNLYTKYRDARGTSEKNRIYGMVKLEDRWLSELLVENGLARIHGVGDDLPDGIAERRYWSRLRTLENTAKRERKGLWGMGGAAAVAGEKGSDPKMTRVILSRRTPVLSAEPALALVEHLPEGHEVRVGEVVRLVYRAVSYTPPGSEDEASGLIQQTFLPNSLP